MDQFDSLFADEDYKAKAPVAPPSTATQQTNYDALFEDSDQLSNSLFTAQGTNPDAEAKKLKLSKELNTPAGILPPDADSLASAKRNDPEQIKTNSPKTAKFLENSDNAKVTGLDGVKGLQSLEAAQKAYTPEAIQTFIKEYTATGRSAAEASQELTKMRNNGVDIKAYNKSRAGRDWADVLPDVGKSIAGGVNTMLAGNVELARHVPITKLLNGAITVFGGPNILDKEQNLLNENQEYWQAEKSPELKAQIDKFNKANIVDSIGMLMYTPSLLTDQLAQSLPYLAPGVAAARGGEASTLAFNSIQEAMDAANSARQEAIQKGASLEDQNTAAAAAAIITAPLAFLGNKLAGTGLLEAKFFTKGSTGHSLLSTMLRESFSGAMEEGGNTLGVNIGAAVTHDPNRDIFDGVAKAAAIGGFLEATHGAGMNTAEKALRLLVSDADKVLTKNSQATVSAATAEATHATVEAMASQAKENDLLKRSPEAFHEFVTTMAEDGNLAEVYVNAKVLDAAMVASGVTQQNLEATMPELVGQLREALATDGDVRITTADYLTHFASTPINEALLPELKADPEGVTYKEAQEFYQTQQETFAKEIDQVATDNMPLMSREEFSQAKELELAIATPSDENTPAAPIQESATSAGILPATYEEYVSEHSNKRAAYDADVKSVENTIKGQFKSAGRFTPSVNAAYTAPLVEFYKQQAKNFNTTPSAMYKKYPFRVQSFLNGLPSQNLSQGEVATLQDFSKENVKDILSKSNWTILTAENPGAKELSPEENASRMAQLTAQLDAEGMAYHLVDGHYGRAEKSLILFNSTPEQALALGRQYDQESVLTRDGYVYQDGTRTPTTGEVVVHDTAPEDYFTTVTMPDGTKSMFTIGLDFDTRLQPGEMYIPTAQVGEGEELNQKGTRPSYVFGKAIAPLAIKAYESLSSKAKKELDNWNVNWDTSELAKATSKEFQEIYTAFSGVREKLREIYGDSVPMHRGERNGRETSDESRKLFSWTPDRELATRFATGATRVPTEISQAEVDSAIEKYNKTGYTALGGYTYKKGAEGYYDIYQGKEHLTDGDNIVEELNAVRTDRKAFIDDIGNRGVVYTANVNVDDIVAIPVGINLINPEYIARANPRVKETKLGQVSIRGVHFSNAQRPTLSGQYFGTGIKGQEADRVRRSRDSRIRNRLYFYVDEGKGVFPEYGVGNFKHIVQLNNMYDAYRNPQKFPTRNADGERDMNLFESAVIDAGFDGYYVEGAFGRQGAAILLGDASKSVKPIGELKQTARKFGAEITAAYKDMANAEGTFAFPKVNGETFEATLNGMHPKASRLDVSRPTQIGQGRTRIRIFNRDTNHAAYLIDNGRGEIWLDLSELKSKDDLGSAMYAAAADYAFYHNKVFIGDPAGLSDVALFRRTENMLSMALKYGTTKHIAPHLKQTDPRFFHDQYGYGKFADDAQALRWIEGDDDFNIASLAFTGYTNLRKLLPEVTDATWNPETGNFEWLDGRPFDADAVAKHSSVRALKENGYGDLVSRKQDVDGTTSESSPIGGRTIRRGLITQSILQGQSAEERGVVLAALSERVRRSGVAEGKDKDFSAILYQSVSLRDGRETLKKYGLDPNKTHMTRDIAAALEARQREKYGSISATDRSPEAIKKIANWMAEEVGFEMQNPNSSGAGWYSEKFQRALDTMAKEFPELATDKAARDTMTSLIAITSDGQKVFGNFSQAMDIYGNFKKTGKFTTLRGHQRTASILGNLANLQRLYDKMGPEVMHEYLMQEKTVSELKKIAKENGAELTTPYQAHIKMPMAAVEFGPKLGAFYANLMGAHGYLTMDRWWSRSFNRYRGTLLTKPTQVGLTRFKELMGNPDMSNDEAIAATVKPAEAYIAKNFKNGTEIERAANTIYKAAFQETEDTPFNASDRTFMLDAVEKARQVLKRRGYDLSIADIQAILWYYEKRLYGDLGARQSADISYEEAAARVVSERAGTSDGQQATVPGSATEPVPVGEELYQPTLGSFNVDTLTTTLLEGANLSTVIHESGHFYLKMLQDLGSRSDAPAQVKEDFLKTMNWFGVLPEEWAAMSLDQQRPYHEQWAESFELWNLEGKAPTLQLQPIFSRFRSWLLSVYKSVEDFLQTHPAAGKLDDEVRGVFSRLMASEEAIKSTEAARGYQPLFATAAEAGVSQGVFDEYLAMGAKATQEGIDALQARSMRDMKWASNARTKALKELQDSAKAERKAIEEEVTLEVMGEPINQARTFLRTGETTAPNGDKVKVTKGFKLNTEELGKMYPKGALDAPNLEGLRGMTSPEGLPPDTVAAMFGFTSGDQLVRTLLDSEDPDAKIEGLTDQRMLEEHGELTDERAMQRAADEAIHNEVRAKFVATGLKMLTNAPISATQMSKAAKQSADIAIANKRVRDIKPKQYLAAEGKANRNAIKLLPTDPNGAVSAQRAALLNNRLAASSQEALTEVEKALKYLAKFNKEGTRKSIDLEYLEQIDALLEPFDLRKGLSLSTIDARASLADWVAMQEAMGFEPTINPEELAASRQKSYKNMTMNEVRALLDGIKQIEHMGRMKKKLLVAQDKAEFAAVVAEARAEMLLNAGEAKKQHATPSDVVGKVAQWGRQMTASHRKFSSLMKQLDGGQSNGFMFNLLVKSGTVAANNETEMLAKAADDMGALFEPVWKGMQDSYLPGNIHAVRKVVPGTKHSMTHEERVMFVMNYGNEGNRQRLLDGGNAETPVYSSADAQAIIDSLTKEELDFVQATWDYIATFKPQIEAQERALTGKTPEWVEPSPFDTKYGTMRGGYYPAKYDVNLSTPAATKEAMTDLRMGMKGLFGAASARNGYAKARAEEVKGRPILLSYSTISTHVSEVVHRLAWQEWLIDAGRLTRALDKDFRTYLGVEGLQEIQKLLRDIADGNAKPKNATERLLAHARKGSTVVGLGWKLSTALLQPIGLANSWGQLGTKAMTAGLMRYLTSPIDSAEWVEGNSLLMKNRARTRERGINEIVNTVRAGKKVTAFQSSFFYLIGKLQRTVDIPTYLAGYEKALGELNYEEAPNESARKDIEKQAHALAEQAVKDTQGAGELFDQAGVQRGGELVKLFTNFYSYMNTVYNQNVNNFRGTDFRSPKEVGEFIAQLVLINIVPAVLSVALKNTLKGTCDWDDKECLVTRYTGEQVGYLLGQMVGLRELSSVSDIITGGKTYGYTGPAGARLVPEVIKAVQQVEQGEADMALFKAVDNVGGILFHYPAGQVNATAAGIAATYDGEVQGWEIPQALISGTNN